MSEPQIIRAVLFREGGMWVGQCLEYDIGAQADSLDELHARLRVVIEAERAESIARNGKAFVGIDPAPEYFHKMWEKRIGAFTPASGRAPDFEMALCA